MEPLAPDQGNWLLFIGANANLPGSLPKYGIQLDVSSRRKYDEKNLEK